MKILTLIPIALTLCLAGCTSIMGGVSGDAPITPDPEGRSMGEVIDDNSLTARLEVNLEKAAPGLKDGRVKVHSNAGVEIGRAHV